MEVRDVLRRRLAGQFLTGKGLSSAQEVVRALGAVQAQDFTGALWAIAQRLAKPRTAAELDRSFAAGEILRTHIMRPTWHFVVPEDIRWMLALTAPRVKAAMAYHDRTIGLDAATLRRGARIISAALEGEQYLTRTELGAVLTRNRIASATGQRLAMLMMHAELDAVVCSGPRRGKHFTYALLDERAPATPKRDRDESLAELARRYFATRGPATLHDFAWWSGLFIADATRAIQIIGSELQTTKLKERDAWFVARRLPRANATAHLLPNYDEYFIGYKDRSAIGSRVRHVKTNAAFMGHLVFTNGELVGGWKRRESRQGVTAQCSAVAKLSGTERPALDAAIRRHSDFWKG